MKHIIFNSEDEDSIGECYFDISPNIGDYVLFNFVERKIIHKVFISKKNEIAITLEDHR